MNIGTIGTGEVAKSLARGFVGLGHTVKFGTRDPQQEKSKSVVAELGSRSSAGTFAEAAAFGEVLLLATLWTGTENALKLAGLKNFEGKVVIDATNPLIFSPGAPPKLALGHIDSGGEQVQRWLPGARVVKAFNILAHAHMMHPKVPPCPPDMIL